MNDQWYLSRNEQQYGPYTWEELVDLYHCGNILPGDMLWNPFSQEWTAPNNISFTNPILNPIQDNLLSRRKKILFLTLGALIITFLFTGIIFILIKQTGPTYLAGISRSLFSKNTKPIQSQPHDEILINLDHYESEIQGQDAVDWRNYPDLKQEQDSIQKTLLSFTQTLKDSNPDTAIQFIEQEKQDAYRELFSSRPEAMESFADIISKAEISFLSAHSPTEPNNRTAEYKVVLDDFTFYIILMKIDDEWVLYDF